MIRFKTLLMQPIQIERDHDTLSSCEVDRQARIEYMANKWRSDLQRAMKAHFAAGKRIGRSAHLGIGITAQTLGLRGQK